MVQGLKKAEEQEKNEEEKDEGRKMDKREGGGSK